MVTRTYEVRTYGCQMNVHDSERIAGLLDEAGYAPVAERACTSLLTARGPMRSVVTVPDR